MKHTIYLKLLLGYAIFITLSLLYIYHEYEEDTTDKHIASYALSLYNQVNGISNYYSKYHYNINKPDDNYSFSNDIKTFMLPDDTTLWLVSSDGKILYSSRYKDMGKIPGDLSSYFDSGIYTTTSFNDIMEEEVLSVYSPIVNTYKTYGYAILSRSLEAVVSDFAPLSNFSYSIFLLMLIFSLSILIVFHIFIFRPIRNVRRAVNEYAKGNFDYEMPKIYYKDEIGDIGEKLNFIATEMKEKDDDQRKFITNISHDFRSPLTSIKGYVEAMLDGTIPPELHENYLNILLFETERLNRLTESLLLLNTWDFKGMRLDITDFDLVSLTRNIVASFEGQCSKKKITLDVVFGSKAYIVNADQTKIQQVIYNLLDNAIKFSHNNSTINIKITDKNDTIFFSIKDSGIGIPKENLNKIWDRFYKTDSSRGKDKTGSGLGLSIVKEVISSHNENINVISTEGVGTEFIFTLQRSKKTSLPIISS